jgi:hypothetical protein
LSDLEDGSLTASELASEFVHALIILAGEAGIDAGDAATLAALDLIVRLAVYGRAPLQVVLDTTPPPLSAAKLTAIAPDACRRH